METIIFLIIILVLIGTAAFIKFKNNHAKKDSKQSGGGSTMEDLEKKPGKNNEFY